MDKTLAVLFFSLCVASHMTEAGLTIGAFNIQRLSDNKVSDPTVLQRIAQILIRFDIATIEEVLHVTAMQTVLNEMNRIGGPYRMTVSDALGNSSYKEHLAIVYRTDKVMRRNHDTYPDDGQDFERQPYSALFHTTESTLTTFALMGVHLRPHEVRTEMNALVDAYEYASNRFGTQNFIIAGDFNADCRYLSNTAYHHTDLWTDDRFDFLISSDFDTTANHNTNCSYDRFVATGEVRAAVVSGSVMVFNFEDFMHLSYDEALDISDHYPVQLQLR